MASFRLRDKFASVALAFAVALPAAGCIQQTTPSSAEMTAQEKATKAMVSFDRTFHYVRANGKVPPAVAKILDDYKNGVIKPDTSETGDIELPAGKAPPFSLLPEDAKEKIYKAYLDVVTDAGEKGELPLIVKIDDEAYRVFVTVNKYFYQNYVRALTFEDLMTGGTKGLFMARAEEYYGGKAPKSFSDMELMEKALETLSQQDPHSYYMTIKEFEKMQEDNRGNFVGLGINIEMKDGESTDEGPQGGKVRVVSPIPGTPAEKAGLQAGDLITHLQEKGGQKISIVKTPGDKGLTLNQAVERMRGTPGTSITLTIEREGVGVMQVTIERDTIEVSPVKTSMVTLPNGERIGHLHLSVFNNLSMDRLREGIQELKNDKMGAPTSWILDLRNNPGGLLRQAIWISDMFLDKGLIVAEKGRSGKFSTAYAKQGDILNGQKLTVLINGGSASASEIVAGALKDNGRATVIGQTSFGKGSVQAIYPLPNNGALRETTQLYYTPSGSIQHKGVVPHVEVKMGWDQGHQRTERGLKKSIPYPGQLKELPPVKSVGTTSLCEIAQRAFTPDQAKAIDQDLFYKDASDKPRLYAQSDKGGFGYVENKKDGKFWVLDEILTCGVDAKTLSQTVPVKTQKPTPTQ